MTAVASFAKAIELTFAKPRSAADARAAERRADYVALCQNVGPKVYTAPRLVQGQSSRASFLVSALPRAIAFALSTPIDVFCHPHGCWHVWYGSGGPATYMVGVDLGREQQ